MVDWSALLRPTSKRILEALLDGTKSLTEISQATGLQKPSLLPHLKHLVELGILKKDVARTGEGRETRYELQAGSFHVEVMPRQGSILTWASAGPVDHAFILTGQVADAKAREEVAHVLWRLQGALSSPAAGPAPSGRPWWDEVYVILFGSVARGQATWKSDVDLLIVSEVPLPRPVRERILDALADAQTEISRACQPHFTTLHAFLGLEGEIERAAAAEGMIVHGAKGDVEIWKRMKRYKRISV